MWRAIYLGMLILGVLGVVSCQKPYISNPTGPAAANTATPTQSPSSTPTWTPTTTASPAVCIPHIIGAATPSPFSNPSCEWQVVEPLAEGSIGCLSCQYPTVPNPAIIQDSCTCDEYFDPSICSPIDFNTQTMIAVWGTVSCGGGEITMVLQNCCNCLYLYWWANGSPLTWCFPAGHYIVIPKTNLPLTMDFPVAQ
jgi:hypothetical protein